MSAIDCSFKSLTSPGSNEILQAQNSLTFKLLKTVADFSQALSTLHDKFGHELQVLVENFRKRNGELRKERLQCPSGLFQVWELFLQQVEVNSQQHGDISRNFAQTIGNGLVERIFHRKIQSKKIFAHRDRIETILLKSNELLLKCHDDYCQAYALALTNPAQYMSEYIASHNVYVHQLQATNGMIHAYQTKTLPKLLEELEECHLETSATISSSLLESSEFVNQKCQEQASGYQLIGQACKQANHRQDLVQFVRIAQQQPQPPPKTTGDNNNNNSETSNNSASENNNNSKADDNGGAGHVASAAAMIRYHQFQSPNLANVSPLAVQSVEPKNMQIVPTFKNEIAPDLSQPPSQQQPQLEQDRAGLEEKIEKFEERIEQLVKLLNRSHESRLHNKVNELQEELSQRRFDLHVARIHLSAVRSQLQLFEYNYRPVTLSSLLPANASGSAQAQPSGAGPTGGSGCGGDLADGSSLTLLAASHQMGGSNYQLNSLQSTGAAVGLSVGASTGGRPSNMHNQSGGYRNKWIKAFKSLQKDSPPPPPLPLQSSAAAGSPSDAANRFVVDEQKLLQQDNLQQHQQQNAPTNQQLENQHFFQEYTFKKIASCDVCKDFLRGHMRQGVKCKLCKISAHNDCQSKAHATLKCQQPKIKLLRRQKSAGELEVNNSDLDGSEQTVASSERSSKPDSIYSLIRQVLDAKKRTNHPQQQQQPQIHPSLLLQANDARGAQLGNGAFKMSSGNLSLANQNGGKSVSTSALQSTTNVSVDRWSVVMNLLAESRKKDKENQDPQDPSGGASGGKRHSKQLDKFKSAAKSVASRHQYLQQQQQQQQLYTSSVQLQQPQQQQQLGPSSSSPLSHQYPQVPLTDTSEYMQQQQQSPQMHLLQPQQQQQQQDGAVQQQQPMHLHHTKSLPVGSKQQQQLINPMQQQPHMMQHPGLAHHQQQQQQQQQQPALGMHPMGGHDIGHAPSSSSAGGPNFGYQHQQPHQLLNISSQQIQSTSAPHSPQRKRFNLRMKSFSLDSPDGPTAAGVGQQQQAPPATMSTVGSAGSVIAPTPSALHPAAQTSGYMPLPFDQQHLNIQQQQQPPPPIYQQQTQHLYHQSGGYSQTHGYLAATAGYQQQQQRMFDDEASNAAYWSRQARHSTSSPYNHRHSYHNPPFHYQHDASATANQKQQSTNAAAAPVGQQQATATGSDSNDSAGSQQQHHGRDSLSGEATTGSKQGRAGSSSAPSGGGGGGQLQPGSQQQQERELLDSPSDYYDLNLDVGLRSQAEAAVGQSKSSPQRQQQQQQQQASPGATYVALYDYNAQRADEIQLGAGQLVALVDSEERDWWKIRPLDGSNRLGYFPASYLTKLYQNERPLQVAQTIQVSDGEICDKLLRGQIVLHTGKQMDSFVTIRLVAGDSSNHYIQCPEKYLMEIVEPV